MPIPSWLTVAFMMIGVLVVLRAAFIVHQGRGTVPGGPFVTLAFGVALVYIGQFLLRR